MRKNCTLKQTRLSYFLIFTAVIALGLLSRGSYVPAIIYPYLGDVLYAVMMYFLLAFLYPQKSAQFLFLVSLSICFGIEFSQLYQADWIVDLRKQKLVALILGSGFLWSDVLAYIVGASASLIIQRKFLKRPYTGHTE
jgi:hypothetical protein